MFVGATAPESSQSMAERLARNHETGSENCRSCKGNEGPREEATLVNRASPMEPYVGRGL